MPMMSTQPTPPPPSGGRRAEASGQLVPMPFLADDHAALVQGLLADNPAAKAAFFTRYATDVERLITHLIGLDRDLADIVQEVFVQALSSIRSLRDPAALKPWLLRIATHCARRTLRSRTRRGWLRFFVDAEEEARSVPISQALDVEGRETLRAMYALLDRVPPDERIAFALRYIDGMDLTEVAAACAVSLATTKRRLRRAEERFLRLARSHPLLEQWVEGGSRWQDR
jgi:RNA polymerase sigma-70 factor (ECF subfamily)